MAFACRPSVIVLDEPTTGLDVSTQAHVLATVRELCRAHGVAALYVTHDLAVVANLADRVAVMYAGRVVEQGPTAELFAGAAHPYTRHLIAAVPDMAGDREVVGLPGRAPSPGRRPVGCAFAQRCEAATDECLAAFPAVDPSVTDHTVRCFHPRAPIADAARGPGGPRAPAATCRPLRPRSRSRGVYGRVHRHDGRPRRRPADRPRRVPRPRRRVRLGQDDGVPFDRRPAPRVDRRRSCSVRRRSPSRRGTVPSSSG